MFTFLSTRLAKRLFAELDNIPQQRLVTYTTMVISASLALLTLLLSSWFYSQQNSNMVQQTIDSYGEGLASLAADRIAATTFHQDPISLQAVVRAIASKKAVNSVVTYDVNNNILAQADKQQGQSTPDLTSTRLQYYTAPVTISSNLAGSITIGIDPVSFNGSISHLPIWCAALLLIAIAISAYRQRKLNQKSIQPTNNTHAVAEHTEAHSADDPELKHHKVDNSLVTLSIQLMNIDTLQQQLNAESRQLQLQQLQQDIDHAAALYNASLINVTNNSIILNFGCVNKDNIFSALCCGQLLLRLNQDKPKAIIAISNTVQCVPEYYQLDKTLPAVQANYDTQNSAHQLFIDPDIIATYQLNKRITLADIDSQNDIEEMVETEQNKISTNFLRVKEFQTSYATLINNQLLQLQRRQGNSQ